MSVEAMLTKLPPGTRLEIDRFNGRWRAAWKSPVTKTWKSISRSWGVRGHQACLAEIMQWSWSLAEGYGEECPYEDAKPSVAPAAPPEVKAPEAKKRIQKVSAKASASSKAPPAKKLKKSTGG